MQLIALYRFTILWPKDLHTVLRRGRISMQQTIKAPGRREPLFPTLEPQLTSLPCCSQLIFCSTVTSWRRLEACLEMQASMCRPRDPQLKTNRQAKRHKAAQMSGGRTSGQVALSLIYFWMHFVQKRCPQGVCWLPEQAVKC